MYVKRLTESFTILKHVNISIAKYRMRSLLDTYSNAYKCLDNIKRLS